MAYDFNGTDQRLRVGSAVVTTTPLTMACWFNPRNVTANMTLISINREGGTGERFGLFPLGGIAGDPIQIDIDGLGVARTTAAYSANTWNHACGVFVSSTSRAVYLNGGNSGTSTENKTTSGNLQATSIGSRHSGVSYGLFMDGLIAEVGIWNVALTDAEIASLADGMTCDKVRPQSLVFYAPLVRDLIDYKGGLTITNNNTATVANHPRVYA
jgi:hypothetical protein